MLWLAHELARSGFNTTFDACDSWVLQGIARLRTRKLGLAVPALVGLALDVMGPKKLAISYISQRDLMADSRLPRLTKRRTLLIPPTVKPLQDKLDAYDGRQVSRVVVSADYASFHNHRGMMMLFDAWTRRKRNRDFSLDLYGSNLPGAVAAGISCVGWAETMNVIFAGRTAVFVPNIGGSGVPNKLIEAMSAQRPIILHKSMRYIAGTSSWLFYYSNADDIIEILDLLASQGAGYSSGFRSNLSLSDEHPTMGTFFPSDS